MRGAIGIGFIWAVAWGALGGIPRWIFGVNTDAPLGLLFGLAGFFSGVVFSVVLGLAERRRRFDQLSLPRFAGWGAVGGFLLAALLAKPLSLGWGDLLALAPTLAVASAACASGSLALARRGGGRALSDGGGDSPELTGHENQTLLDKS